MLLGMVRYLKRLKSSRLGRVQAFPMYGGLGMSAPSLHRESTDSLIVWCGSKGLQVGMAVLHMHTESILGILKVKMAVMFTSSPP